MRIILLNPDDRHLAMAKEFGVDCKLEFEKYKDWLAANGKVHKDEAAGFRNWLRKAGEYRQRYSAAYTTPMALSIAHTPAKLPEVGERSEMPEHVRGQLLEFNRRFKTKVNI